MEGGRSEQGRHTVVCLCVCLWHDDPRAVQLYNRTTGRGRWQLGGACMGREIGKVCVCLCRRL